MFEIELICIKMDLALNNLQRLICHKTKTTKTILFPVNYRPEVWRSVRQGSNALYPVTLVHNFFQGFYIQGYLSLRLTALLRLESLPYYFNNSWEKKWKNTFPKGIRTKWLQSQLEIGFGLPIPFFLLLTPPVPHYNESQDNRFWLSALTTY